MVADEVVALIRVVDHAQRVSGVLNRMHALSSTHCCLGAVGMVSLNHLDAELFQGRRLQHCDM